MKVNLIGAAKNAYAGISTIGDALEQMEQELISKDDFAELVYDAFRRYQPQAAAYSVVEVLTEMTSDSAQEILFRKSPWI